MAATCDVVVVGLGAMGSAATMHLARAGVSVIGLDASMPPNPSGSSHGETRITRLGVGEGAAYVPLVQRSHELWRQHEDETGESLLVQCGGLILGGLKSTGQHGVPNFVAATIEVARAHGIAHEVLDAEAIAARFGAFAIDDEVAYFEPSAGYLRAQACIRAHLALALRAGASLRLNERVLGWTSSSVGVTVTTSTDTISAGSIVLAVGPWLPDLAPELAPVLSVQRQVQCWFDVRDADAAWADVPVFIWMHGAGEGEYFYGFPAVDGPGGGVKVATERFGIPTNPQDVDRAVGSDEIAGLHADHVEGRLALAARCLRSAVCLYTVTPDFGFIIDRHPSADHAVIASPCSGHGFKHAAAVGECVAQLALEQPPSLDVTPFAVSRFAKPT